MAEGAVVVEAGEEVVSHVVVPEWGQSATAEATAAADRVTPDLSPTIRAGKVPYLIAAVMPRVIALSVRVTGRTAALNTRVTGKKNRENGRKPAVSAGKKPLTAGRNGVKITTATI